MIDTHAHIYLPQFSEDILDVLLRASQASVTDILMPSIVWDSSTQMDEVIKKKQSDPRLNTLNLYQMGGIHPCDARGLTDYDRLFAWCAQDHIVAVGETGLDYYWSTDHVEDQKNSLITHCQIAIELNKPIVLHNRESTSDLLDLIVSQQNGALSGVWHCFNGTVDEGKRALDLGLKLGIGGVVTFKNGGVDKTVAHFSLEDFILETDAPYLAPTPHRGQRNEPSYTQLVAIKLSEIFSVNLSEVDRITTQNARNLFKLETR